MYPHRLTFSSPRMMDKYDFAAVGHLLQILPSMAKEQQAAPISILGTIDLGVE